MFDLPSLIRTVGYLGIFGIVFAESGLFIGFFLPGDSLLFTAGFLASQEHILNIWVLLALTFSGAVLGDSVGYAFGRRVGPSIFRKENSIFFRKDHLERARLFYLHHGRKTIILARFMPVVRTFAPILAGVAKMHYPTFLTYNVIGGALWALGMTSLGYFLGESIPNIDRYIIPIVIAIIIISMLPGTYQLLKDERIRGSIARSIRKAFRKL